MKKTFVLLDTNSSPEQFESQLNQLAENGYFVTEKVRLRFFENRNRADGSSLSVKIEKDMLIMGLEK